MSNRTITIDNYPYQVTVFDTWQEADNSRYNAMMEDDLERGTIDYDSIGGFYTVRVTKGSEEYYL